MVRTTSHIRPFFQLKVSNLKKEKKKKALKFTLNCAPTVGFLVAGIPWRALLNRFKKNKKNIEHPNDLVQNC